MNLNAIKKGNYLTFVNCDAATKIVDKNGNTNYLSLPVMANFIHATDIEQARIEIAKRLNIRLENISQWEILGEEDGFAHKLYIVVKDSIASVTYTFDVYMTVNVWELLPQKGDV